jgi:predicted nucleic acid-binding protein
MLVVDASVVIKLYVPEEGSEAALALVSADPVRLIPAHGLAQIAESLSRKVRQGLVARTQAEAVVSRLHLRFEQVPLDALIVPATNLAIETGASVYDTLYVALAAAENCRLVTADRRLVEKLSNTPHAGLLSLLDSSIGSR